MFSENPDVYGHWDTRAQDALWDKMVSHQSDDTKIQLVRFLWDGPAPESGKRRLNEADVADYMADLELTPTKNQEIFDTNIEAVLDQKFL